METEQFPLGTQPNEMSSDEQQALWLAGDSVHNHNNYYTVVDANDKPLYRAKSEGGECCPDFSCCKPELKWSPEVRQEFVDGDQETKYRLMGMALGAAMSLAAKENEAEGKEPVKVYIATGQPDLPH